MAATCLTPHVVTGRAQPMLTPSARTARRVYCMPAMLWRRGRARGIGDGVVDHPLLARPVSGRCEGRIRVVWKAADRLIATIATCHIVPAALVFGSAVPQLSLARPALDTPVMYVVGLASNRPMY